MLVLFSDGDEARDEGSDESAGGTAAEGIILYVVDVGAGVLLDDGGDGEEDEEGPALLGYLAARRLRMASWKEI